MKPMASSKLIAKNRRLEAKQTDFGGFDTFSHEN